MRNPTPVVAARLLPTAPRREGGKEGRKEGKDKMKGLGGGGGEGGENTKIQSPSCGFRNAVGEDGGDCDGKLGLVAKLKHRCSNALDFFSLTLLENFKKGNCSSSS